ncbi:ABC transporter ATP-binding protein [Cellulosilyticum sp. I15G10I2]|uniref:ABC transporter ATP-binding protein n=1 Tax=Cellulosilyticum sp. I15G10I2 TaxID=1892843 RepID=UPI00085CBAC8|nr:ATP-binding cassette domain-containing protein [Cellulosilyticum sp. I15G10I2]
MFTLNDIKFKTILDINYLHIPAQKVTCIVGESGSGKTTLIKLLNKMLTPTQGEILFGGQSINHINAVELRRKVPMLPQSPAIFTGSIKDNLLIGLTFGEKPFVSDDRLHEILAIVHLNKDLNDDAENLSGGEKQRVALGRMLLIEPEVLLLDEPSSALDESTEKFIIEKLTAYTKQNHKTLIMVTHSKRVAQNFADYIVVLSNGKVADQKEVQR